MNLIGGTEFRNETSSSPRNHSRCTRSFPSSRAESGNKTPPSISLRYCNYLFYPLLTDATWCSLITNSLDSALLNWWAFVWYSFPCLPIHLSLSPIKAFLFTTLFISPSPLLLCTLSVLCTILLQWQHFHCRGFQEDFMAELISCRDLFVDHFMH